MQELSGFQQALAEGLGMDEGSTGSILVQSQELKLEETVGDVCSE